MRRGDDARSFIDDRYDMSPVSLSNDYATLLGAQPGALKVLDQRGVDVVLWDKHRPLVELLSASSHWRLAHRAGDWDVFVRR